MEQTQKSTLSYFNTFFVFFGISVIIEFFYMGVLGIVQGTTLTILELSLSFDNAVVNALILVNMPPIWRRRFLTWGMLIAVFGVRLIFPILIVFATTDLSLVESFSLAINNPAEYEKVIMASHHIVMAFAGIFLIMIFLSFLFNENKDVYWIAFIEKYASRWSSIGEFTKVKEWNNLKQNHENVHKKVQEYMTKNATKAENQHLRKTASEIEEGTIKVFDSLNDILYIEAKSNKR